MQMNEGALFYIEHLSRGSGGLLPPDVGAKSTFASLSFPFLDITESFFIEEK